VIQQVVCETTRHVVRHMVRPGVEWRSPDNSEVRNQTPERTMVGRNGRRFTVYGLRSGSAAQGFDVGQVLTAAYRPFVSDELLLPDVVNPQVAILAGSAPGHSFFP